MTFRQTVQRAVPDAKLCGSKGSYFIGSRTYGVLHLGIYPKSNWAWHAATFHPAVVADQAQQNEEQRN